MDIKDAFPFQSQQNFIAENLANIVSAATGFTSGTTKNTDAGFTACRKGTILITTVSETTSVYLITAIAEDGKMTGVALS